MHFCFLNAPEEFYSPVSGGAVATIIMQTARALEARGHEVTVVTMTGDDPRYDVGRVIPIPRRTRENLSFLQRRLAGLRRRLHRWDWPYYGYYMAGFCQAIGELSPPPDAVILFNDLVSARYIARVAPAAKILVWLQNEQRTNQSNIAEAVAATHAFLTCSGYIRDWTCRTHGIPAGRVVVAHSGVDLDAFRPAGDFPRIARPLRVLFLGRIDPNKGPDICADSVAALREEGLAVELTVAGGLWFYRRGDDDADPFLQLLREKMNAAGAAYLGHVTRDKVPALVAAHDVVMVLSRSQEPFALVALEAMACGCAVIASDRGGLPEACGGAAMLVNPDDFPAVVGLLRALATDGELLREQKMKSVARARLAPWSATAEVVESVAAADLAPAAGDRA